MEIGDDFLPELDFDFEEQEDDTVIDDKVVNDEIPEEEDDNLDDDSEDDSVQIINSFLAENTAFDVEINHPEHGWIPYGLNPDDTDMTVDNSVLLELIGSDFGAYVAPTAEELEAEIKDKLNKKRSVKKYRPILESFSGYSECFNYDGLDEIVKIFDELVSRGS